MSKIFGNIKIPSLTTTTTSFSENFSGIIGSYKFSNSLAVGEDSSGSARTATIVGTPTITNSLTDGSRLRYNVLNMTTNTAGANYIHLTPHLATYQGLANISVSFWIKRASTGTLKYLVAFIEDANNYLSVEINSSNNLAVTLKDASVNIIRLDTSTAIANDLWHHIVVSLGALGPQVYIDNNLQTATYSAGSTNTNALNLLTIANINIGKFTSTTNSFDGYIDNVAFYNKQLDRHEVDDLYYEDALSDNLTLKSETVSTKSILCADITGNTFNFNNSGYKTEFRPNLFAAYEFADPRSLGKDTSANSYLGDNLNNIIHLDSFTDPGSVTRYDVCQFTQSAGNNTQVQCIDLSDNASVYTALTAMTISFWLRTPTVSSMTLFSINGTAAGNNFVIKITPANNISLTYQGTLSASMTIPSNETHWVHVVIGLGNSTSVAYINNTLKTISGITIPASVFSGVFTVKSVFIGAENPALIGASNGFSGYISDVLFFNTILTATEIELLYNNKTRNNIVFNTMQTLVQDGTAAIPSIGFVNDIDTGIYRIGANNIGFATNGVLRFNISDSGFSPTLPVSISDTTAATSTTTGSINTLGGLGVSKNIWLGANFTSAFASTTTGNVFHVPPFTITDNVTGAGTLTNVNIVSLHQVTLASTNAITATNAATLYIANAPTIASNVTITNSYALHIGVGESLFGGRVNIAYQAGGSQIRMARASDGAFNASMYVDSNNYFNFNNTSGSRGFIFSYNVSTNGIGITLQSQLATDNSSQIFQINGSTGSAYQNALNFGTSTTGGQLSILSPNTATLPAYTFITDLTTGMYRIGAGNIGFTTSGTLRFNISTTGITSTLPMTITDATQAISSSTGCLILAGGIGMGNGITGTPPIISWGQGYTFNPPAKLIALYDITGNNYQYFGFGISTGQLTYTIDVTTNNHVFYAGLTSSTRQELFRIKGNQTVQLQNGTVSLPSLSFQNDTSNDTGLYRVAEDSMGISTGGKLNLQNTFVQPSLTVPFTDSNIFAYYSFRNGLTTDTTANAYTLTNNGTTTTTDRTDSTNGITLYNTATFNGTSQYLSRDTSGDTVLRAVFNELATIGGLSTTPGITISMWIFNTNAATVGEAFCATSATGAVAVGTDQTYLIYYNGSGSLVFSSNNTTTATYIQANYTISQSIWYHIIISFSHAGLHLYVNGVNTPFTSFTTGTSIIAPVNLNNINRIYIGIRGTTNYWSGSIKNVMLYKLNLSDSQVKQIYNTQLCDVASYTNSLYAFTGDLRTGIARTKNNSIAIITDAMDQLNISTAGTTICHVNTPSIRAGSLLSGSINLSEFTKYEPPIMNNNIFTVTVGSQTITYEITASTTYASGATFAPFSISDNNTATYWHASDSSYTSSTGAYLGSKTTVIDGISRLGEWIQIDMGRMQSFSAFTMLGRSTLETTRMPNLFYIAGSNDGLVWSAIYTSTADSITWGSTPQTFSISTSHSYRYFRLVASTVGNSGQVSNRSSVNLSQWVFTKLANNIIPGTTILGGSTLTNILSPASTTTTSTNIIELAQSTLVATNASNTITRPSSFYIAGAPIKGTNETFTNVYGLYIDSAATTSATVTEAASLYIANAPTVTSGTTYGMKVASGTCLFGGAVQFASGSVTTPSITFSADASFDTGFYWLSEGIFAATSNSTQQFTLGGGFFNMTGCDVLLRNGSAGQPSLAFGTSTTTGMYRVGADNIGFSTATALRFDISTTAITSTLPYITAVGTAAAPSYSFTGDPNTGMYNISADILGFSSGGVRKLSLGSATHELWLSPAATATALRFLTSGGITYIQNSGSFDATSGSPPSSFQTIRFSAYNSSTSLFDITSVNVLAPIGSAGTPGYSFTGNAGGMYAAANLIGLSASGVEVFTASVNTTNVTTFTFGRSGIANSTLGAGNYLAFSGIGGDSGYGHTIIAERTYLIASDKTELLLYKGNDITGANGPDRIRLRAGELRFQVYTSGEVVTAQTVNDDNDMLVIDTTKILANLPLTISSTSNQIVLGTTDTTTITSVAPAASRTYTIRDAGGAADFVMTVMGSPQSISSILNLTSGITSSSTTTGALVVTGGVGVSGNVHVGGDLTVGGTVTTINSTNLNITDSMIGLATNNTASDAIDIGFWGKYSATPLYAGLIRDASNGEFYFFKGISENLSAATSITTDLSVDTNRANVNVSALKCSNNATSSSSTTGAVQVAGGIGVAGASFFTSSITTDDALYFNNATTGSRIWDGNVVGQILIEADTDSIYIRPTKASVNGQIRLTTTAQEFYNTSGTVKISSADARLTVNTPQSITNTSTTALVVEDASGNDTFTVDTSNSHVTIRSPITGIVNLTLTSTAGSNDVQQRLNFQSHVVNRGGGLRFLSDATADRRTFFGRAYSSGNEIDATCIIAQITATPTPIEMEQSRSGTADINQNVVFYMKDTSELGLGEGNIGPIAILDINAKNSSITKLGNPNSATANLFRIADLTMSSTSLGAPLASTHTAEIGQLTYTDATATQSITTSASLRIKGPPIGGTNVTITNPYSLYIDTGTSYFGGDIIIKGSGILTRDHGLAVNTSDTREQTLIKSVLPFTSAIKELTQAYITVKDAWTGSIGGASAMDFYCSSNPLGAQPSADVKLLTLETNWDGSTNSNHGRLRLPNTIGSMGMKIDNATASTSSTTGALVVSGGIGTAQASYFAAALTVDANAFSGIRPLYVQSNADKSEVAAFNRNGLSNNGDEVGRTFISTATSGIAYVKWGHINNSGGPTAAYIGVWSQANAAFYDRLSIGDSGAGISIPGASINVSNTVPNLTWQLHDSGLGFQRESSTSFSCRTSNVARLTISDTAITSTINILHNNTTAVSGAAAINGYYQSSQSTGTITSTTSSGTINFSYFAAPVLSAGILGSAATLHIAGAPSGGTITSSYSLQVATGATLFGGNLYNGIASAVMTTSTITTASGGNTTLIPINAATNITLTLPTTTDNNGLNYTLINIGTSAVTISVGTPASESFNGVGTSITLNIKEKKNLVCYNSVWWA